MKSYSEHAHPTDTAARSWERTAARVAAIQQKNFFSELYPAQQQWGE